MRHRMRVLLANHHLQVRSGSELATVELSGALRQRGCEVAIFAFFKGPLACEWERSSGIRIFDMADRDEVIGFAPDIVHSHHHPCFHYLRALIPGAARVHSLLGWLPALESPPVDGRVDLGLVVSEEVLGKVAQSGFAQPGGPCIFRSWVDDRAIVRVARRPASTCLRAVVVSNHLAAPLVAALNELVAAGELTVDYFGVETASVEVNGELLADYDVVFSIGRTVLLAAACGVPVVLADVHGSDGLLTVHRLDAVRTVNFSGRFRAEPITAEAIRAELAAIPGVDLERLSAAVCGEYTLSRRADWLIDQYGRLMAIAADRASERLSCAEPFVPQEGVVYADLAGQVVELTAAAAVRDMALRERDRQLAALLDVAGQVAELTAAGAVRDMALQERDRQLAALLALLAQRAREFRELEERLDGAQATVLAITDSTAWRATRPLRALVERLPALRHGTRWIRRQMARLARRLGLLSPTFQILGC